ncbi:ribonucleoside-triphosphate reductase, adenosylcobalamin-dependent [Synechococcus sp. W55.1]|uniref:ribonucleoside-triphosphate reductase, adenosylcobalamin-dependent n=1 Tax=Synechococcus sp. W55.1 TaxID=2964512 RepID=UPI0039C24C6E
MGAAPPGEFPATAPAASPVFYRTYSRRRPDGSRETWSEVCDRTLADIARLGRFTPQERQLVERLQRQLKALISGRALWVMGTDWIQKPENFSGAYNCTSTTVVDWQAFGLMMDLAMMGCGTGAVLEPQFINRLPPILNRLQVHVKGSIGATPPEERQEHTRIHRQGSQVHIQVGDSRRGWVDSYQALLELASDPGFGGQVDVTVDLSDIRPAGERLKGFGGVANPIKLPGLYERCAAILNRAVGRQLNSVECCLLIDEAAVTVVAGNIRRCLPENALVHTSQGLVPIKDVQVGDWVQTPLGFRRVVNKFDQGIQEVYEIETNAIPFFSTPNHRHAVLADAQGNIEWKSTHELAEGDRLLHNTQVLPGTITHLPEDFTGSRPKQSHTAKPLTIPPLTPEVAWLIGFTHGDGYVALGRNRYGKPYGRVEWSANALDPELLSRLQAKLEQGLAAFGLTATCSYLQGENTAKFVCSSIRLAEYFQRHIKKPKQPLQVPDFILRGTVEVRSAYLAGLIDSDGSICSRPPQLATTVHRSFALQVAAVLSSLGIAGRLKIICPHQENWQVKYSLTLPAFKDRYNALVAPYSAKGKLPQGLKMYGFTIPGSMLREVYSYTEMRGMGFQGARSVEANYERYLAESEVDLDIPVTFKGLGSHDWIQTYDIEVEEAHCFYCNGYLTHNSAGMRQFAADDELGSTAKDNLWQQDENGNWRIDPERDALRMANHTRVFHRKPTREECVEAVRKQFYSGEGAIQWAGEAVARANCDLIPPDLKPDFLKAYEAGTAREWLKGRDPSLGEEELQDRLWRYGLNPCGEVVGHNFHCVAGSTLLITRDGLHPIQSLVGKPVEIWNGRRWSWVVPVCTGRNRQMYRVIFADGTWLDVTGQHRFFVSDRFSSTYTELTTEELREHLARHPYALHTEPFQIDYRDGELVDPIWAYTLGQLVGDGSLCKSNGRPQLQLHLYGAKSYRNLTLAGRTSGQLRYYATRAESSIPCLLYTGFHEFDPEQVRALKTEAQALEKLAAWNREGILHFIAGLIDADGSATSSGGVRLYVSGYDRAYRLYLLLLKCGIRSSINLAAKAGSETNLGRRRKDLWYLQITDCAAIPCQRVDTSRGHVPQAKAKWQVIRSVEPLPDLHDSFCFNEPEFHKGVFGGTLTGQCNLAEIHLNRLDPHNRQEQEEAFTAGALTVAALLHHRFVEPRFQRSREWDPIVGVSFTGLFDFCVKAFGVEWLRWWQEGRPDTPAGKEFKQQEREYLSRWKEIVHRVVWDYCDRHGLRRPNRCTTVQPAGTKSLLTNASPGWHPPKAQRYIRRITFAKNDPVALACLDYGYSVVPAQADKDENGNLLNDPFDPRCTEWLVELPVEVEWANLPGADQIEIEQFSALAQFDFYMQVQRYYTTHNTSATIELREDEVEALGSRIYEAIRDDEGYISAALLARFDAPFPRLPFEKIDKPTYERLVAEVKQRRRTDNFFAALARHDRNLTLTAEGPAGCDALGCLLPDSAPQS